ncbi:MAG: diguanylate cyclase [Pseudoxanthomonas sp.]
MSRSPQLSHRFRLLRDQLLVALIVAITVGVSLTLARLPGEIAAVWVTNGVLVGWLLSRGTVRWPGYLLAGFAAQVLVRWLIGDGLLIGMMLSAINLIEVLIVAGVVRRLVPDIRTPKHWLGLGGIATIITLVACAITGLLASALVSTTSDTPFPTRFLIWYSAHVLGMVVVATLTLVIHAKRSRLIDEVGKRWDFVGSMLFIAVVCGAVFSQSAYPLLFLIYLPLIFGVYRHRFTGLVVGMSLVGVIGISATALGYGPLMLVGDGRGIERIIVLQLFLTAACAMSFPVALITAERARLTTRLYESKMRYRMMADYSHDLVLRMRADGHTLYVSPSARDILGWEPEDILGPSQQLVHPDDRGIHQNTITAVLASGHPITAIYRLRHKDDHHVWMEQVARPIPSEHGEATDLIFAGRDITKRVGAEQALQASRRELELQARVDSLTGLANRRQFDERLALALTRSRRHGFALALMYMDIDYFKQVNDTLGHAAGDEVLRVFGQRLNGCVRAGDLVARLGGDEFVVLVEDLGSPAAAELIARKLIEVMGESLSINGSSLVVTTSIGIAYSSHPAVATALMSSADAALYTAKREGRNRYQLVMTDETPQASI